MSNVPMTAEQMADFHLFNAKNGRKPTNREAKIIDDIQEQAKTLARTIFLDVPPNRNRSLAITALEDVAMRAVRAIFEPKTDIG